MQFFCGFLAAVLTLGRPRETEARQKDYGLKREKIEIDPGRRGWGEPKHMGNRSMKSITRLLT
jgi:hypothetical protein